MRVSLSSLMKNKLKRQYRKESTQVWISQKIGKESMHALWWQFSKTLMWHHLYHVFTYFLLIEKDICDHQNVSIKLLRVCVCFLPGYLFIFSIRVSSFFFYFLCYFYFGAFLSTWSISINDDDNNNININSINSNNNNNNNNNK